MWKVGASCPQGPIGRLVDDFYSAKTLKEIEYNIVGNTSALFVWGYFAKNFVEVTTLNVVSLICLSWLTKRGAKKREASTDPSRLNYIGPSMNAQRPARIDICISRNSTKK